MRIAVLLIALTLPLTGVAQSQTTPARPAVKPTAVKVTKGQAKALARPSAEPDTAEPVELDAERLAVAPLVLQGEASCEFGNKVHVKEHPTLRGRFQLMFRGLMHTLTPHPTTTGVVRLEDKRSGLVWLQVPIKSMLMDSKKGQRVVDNCMHPTQLAEVASARDQSATSLQ